MKIRCPLCGTTDVKAECVTTFGTYMKCNHCEEIFREEDASTKVEV